MVEKDTNYIINLDKNSRSTNINPLLKSDIEPGHSESSLKKKRKNSNFSSNKISNSTRNNEIENLTNKIVFGKNFLVPIKNYNLTRDNRESIDYRNLSLKESSNFEDTESQYYEDMKNKLQCNLDPNYFNKQVQIKPWMRSVLLEWLMALSSNLCLKRATYHLAVVLVDVCLSKLPQPILSIKLQLLGITCLVIAVKIEEIIVPPMAYFSFSTENAYSTSEIISYEQTLLQMLDWKITLPTYATWANLITIKWDLWLNIKISYDSRLRRLPFFRLNMISPLLFQRFFTCVDLAVLNIDSLQFDGVKFMSALLYIVIGYFSKQIPFEAIMEISMGTSELGMMDNFYVHNNFTDMFLNECMNLSLHEIALYIPIACHLFCSSANNDFEISHQLDFSNSKVIFIISLYLF